MDNLAKEYFPPETKPSLLILLSGKRKCGKDYLTDLLYNRLEAQQLSHIVAIMRIAAVFKRSYAQTHSLDFDRLSDSSSYKEPHRIGMLDWSDQVRAQGAGYLCCETIKVAHAEGKQIWICADIRDPLDYAWFLQHYAGVVKRVRIQADEGVRKERGFVWLDGMDDGKHECGLDPITDWDLLITNNGVGEQDLEAPVSTILSWIHGALKNKDDAQI